MYGIMLSPWLTSSGNQMHTPTTTTAREETVQANPLAQWEDMIETANDAFEREDNPLALGFYQRALTLANATLKKHPWANGNLDIDARQAILNASIAATIVTHHNLAYLYQRLKKTDLAADHYRQAYLTANALGSSEQLEDNLRQLALRHVAHALGEFMSFQNRHGACGTNAATSACLQ